MEMVNIRSIQHFLYCPHRWGLIEIGQCWAENYYVVKANLMHNRVHERDRYISRGKTVYTSVSVWNDNYGLFGVTDCIEKTDDGLYIVEYKPKKPPNSDYNIDDALQVYAQKLCVDYVFGGDCKAEIYYADVKKRVSIPFDTQGGQFDTLIKDILSQIRYNAQKGVIPPVRKDQNCCGCSMKDMCMPKIKTVDLRKQISKIMEND
jgi:CRISPR-associated exonuclease Cas4